MGEQVRVDANTCACPVRGRSKVHLEFGMTYGLVSTVEWLVLYSKNASYAISR